MSEMRKLAIIIIFYLDTVLHGMLIMGWRYVSYSDWFYKILQLDEPNVGRWRIFSQLSRKWCELHEWFNETNKSTQSHFPVDRHVTGSNYIYFEHYQRQRWLWGCEISILCFAFFMLPGSGYINTVNSYATIYLDFTSSSCTSIGRVFIENSW